MDTKLALQLSHFWGKCASVLKAGENHFLLIFFLSIINTYKKNGDIFTMFLFQHGKWRGSCCKLLFNCSLTWEVQSEMTLTILDPFASYKNIFVFWVIFWRACVWGLFWFFLNAEDCHFSWIFVMTYGACGSFDMKFIFLNPQLDILALNFRMQLKSQKP